MDNSRIFSNFASVFNKSKTKGHVRKLYIILLFTLIACIGCQWRWHANDDKSQPGQVVIERFDRAERLFLTTGDFAALQQMKTVYPIETRTLIEDVLKLGLVDQPDINARFLHFFQDSTLQTLMLDVEKQYHDLSDLNKELTEAFQRMAKILPDVQVPRIYTQIGSLDQSIVVGDSTVGISLDKYLGKDYPVYLKYGYTEEQRQMMTRQYIVPDCLGFYLLGHYPMPEEALDSLPLRDAHMAKIQYVINRVLGRTFFTREAVRKVDGYMKHHTDITPDILLNSFEIVKE